MTSERALGRDPPLVPRHIVDDASQRLLAASIFVLIQSWKVYDILLVKADAFAHHDELTTLNEFTFVLKYAAIDGLFLWLLPVLRIPNMTFSPVVTILLTLALNGTTLLLASSSAVPFLSVVALPIWNVFKGKELTIVGDTVTPQNVVDIDLHFRGRYTIQYVPELSVMLNPLNETSCLGRGQVFVPIEFNTTSELKYMQIQHIAPDNHVSLLNYTARDIKRMRDRRAAVGDRVFRLNLEVKKPGTYRLARVTDTEGMSIRAYKSHYIAADCPTATFTYPGPNTLYEGNKCTGDKKWILPRLAVHGVSPLKVEVAVSVGGRTLGVFNTTLNKASRTLEAVDIEHNSLEKHMLKGGHFLGLLNSGTYHFHINKVIDSRGQYLEYNPASRDKDIHHTFRVKKAAELSLKRHSGLLLSGKSAVLHFNAKDVLFPLLIVLTHDGKNRTHKFNDGTALSHGIVVEEPGTYTLATAQDQFCPCILGETSVSLKTPPRPSVSIVGEPLSDKCLGTVGFNFTLLYNGTGPFETQFQVFQNVSGHFRQVSSSKGSKFHSKKSSSNKDSFLYKPPKEGSYVIVFSNTRDRYYQESPVLIDEKANTFATYLRRRSSISFFANNQKSKVINLCKGAKTSVPLYLKGNAPFSFTYEIVGKKVISKSVFEWTENEYTFDTPVLDGGEYTVRIKDGKDGLGCPIEQPSESLVISSRSDTPKASFKSQHFEIVEGDVVEVPLDIQSLIGSTPQDKITVLHDGNKKEFSGSRLRLTKQGSYKLHAYENAGCQGVTDDRVVTVKYHPRPSLVVTSENTQAVDDQSLNLRNVCQHGGQSIKLHLVGSAPFLVRYLIVYPSGRTKKSLIQVDSNEVTIQLPTDEAGVYKHLFTQVYDQLYTEAKMERLRSTQKEYAVSYSVHEPPTIQVEPTEINLCESDVDSLNVAVSLSPQGHGPFSVSGHIRHLNGEKAHRFSLVDVDHTVSLHDIVGRSLSGVFDVGNHLIVFDEVADSNVCLRMLTSYNTVEVNVVETPKISKRPLKSHYCVGDHVAYNMSGNSPFSVYYLFNGVQRKADTEGEFKRLASKAGILAIEALQDASSCLVNYTLTDEYEPLKLEVHNLPSVEISQGDSIIANLHEGDQTEIKFTFSGVPPFSVTYVRTLPDGKRRRVVDRKRIDNVSLHDYVEVVSLEGTYEAIEIRDAYCVATRDVESLL